MRDFLLNLTFFVLVSALTSCVVIVLLTRYSTDYVQLIHRLIDENKQPENVSSQVESTIDKVDEWVLDEECGCLVYEGFKIVFDNDGEPDERFKLYDPEGRYLREFPYLSVVKSWGKDLVKDRNEFNKKNRINP